MVMGILVRLSREGTRRRRDGTRRLRLKSRVEGITPTTPLRTLVQATVKVKVMDKFRSSRITSCTIIRIWTFHIRVGGTDRRGISKNSMGTAINIRVKLRAGLRRSSIGLRGLRRRDRRVEMGIGMGVEVGRERRIRGGRRRRRDMGMDMGSMWVVRGREGEVGVGAVGSRVG